jgi:hypothetical protein
MFAGLDVMKSAGRVDLSLVDLGASPWRNDPQCTGCHASLDPVAGAFQHWTNCYGLADVRYFEERYCDGPWFPEADMYPPGVAAGDENRLSAEQMPAALAHLAAHTVARPAFARAIAAHVFATLLGRAPLEAPVDPGDPDFGARQAAFERDRATIDDLGRAFADAGLDFEVLVTTIVRTEAFRARTTRQSEDDPRLAGLGGGALIEPERLHRKVEALFGVPYGLALSEAPGAVHSLRDPPYPLLSLHRFRLLAGGIDSRRIRSRARFAGSVSLAVVERMALEMTCRYAAWDLARPVADRVLFPGLEAGAADATPAAERRTLQRLHDRFLGERLADDAPALDEAHARLLDFRAAGAQGLAAGRIARDLSAECRAETHFATGEVLPGERRITTDPTYAIRAWQAYLVSLMTDPRFYLEP